MPFGSVRLIPGVNVERTPMLNEAGISASSLIRFKDSLVQKYGGWESYYSGLIPGIPRDLHGWIDLNNTKHLAVGTTTALQIITSGVASAITPQTLTSNFVPNVSTTGSSTTVGITDPNISNVTTFDAVLFATPVSQGGLILSGLYPIASITGTHSYTIAAAAASTTTEANPTATNNTTASGNNTLHFASTPTWITAGMLIWDLTAPTAIPTNTTVVSTTGITVVMSNNAAGAGVGSGDSIVFSNIPVFLTTSGSATVSVNLPNHGVSVGSKVEFEVSTTGNGVTISGDYTVLSVTDINNFTIAANTQANASGSFVMNGGNAQIVYYLNLGPSTPGQGYGLGQYGSGAYGYGTSGGSAQTGTPINALDWTSDNWGEVLLECPAGGGVYQYDPTGGFSNAGIIATAPPFNGGIFVSIAEQILVCWGSSVTELLGIVRDPLLVQWSTVGDYTNFQVTAATQAGNFRIPTGSKIMAGLAATNQNLIWTDLDLWAMNYIGPPDVFGFNKIGAGAGAISSHAVQSLRGSVYWMGNNNFYAYVSGGAQVIPCPVWDAVFQNLNTSFTQNVRAMPNTPFNEVGWLFPSVNSLSGECDSWVKFNITEPGNPWDICIGGFSRSAWIDQGPLGMPIGATPQGAIYLQETTNDAAGAALTASFTTGYFYLAEGEDFAFVDQIIPDFKWSLYSGGASANILMSFSVVNYPGDTPTVYGPYTVTQATEYLFVRFRGRLMSITVASADVGSFWRLGLIKYRYGPAGRR